MPQPTREQFDAAAKKVLASAPPGLSKEEFYALIDKELTPFTPVLRPANPGGVTSDVTKEPDTYWGGFIKGLKDYTKEGLSGLMPALESAAHPTTAGDVATLILPTGMGYGDVTRNSVGAMKNLARAGGEGAQGRTGLRKVGGMLRGMFGEATDSVSGHDRAFQRAPLAQQIEALAPDKGISQAPARKVIPPTRPDVTEVPFNELPLWKQMEQMPETAAPVTNRGGGPIASGVEDPLNPLNPPKPPAKTLENVLDNVLLDVLSKKESPTGGVSLPPSGDITPGGTTRQSGKFGKSGSLGQAGGYTSGRPAVSETRYDELLRGAAGKNAPLGPEEAPPSVGGVSSPDPAIVAEERRMYGSAEAAKRLGITEEEVLRLSPGPSQIPLTAEERIREGRGAAAMGEAPANFADILRSIINNRGGQ